MPFDPTLEAPWPWLRSLPSALDEPLVYGINSPGENSRVVSRSGRQWGTGQSGPSAISRDGWSVAWWNSDKQLLVIRDLANGSSLDVPASWSGEDGSLPIYPDIPMWWNPDNHELAVTSMPGVVSVVDVPSGDVRRVAAGATAVGWRDATTLIVADWPDADGRSAVRALNIDGGQSSLLVTIDGLDTMSDTRSAEVSPDGTRLAVGTYDEGASSVAVVDLTTGASRGVASFQCAWPPTVTWMSDQQIVLCPTTTSPKSPTRVMVADLATGTDSAVISISARVGQVSDVSVASDVTAVGPSGAPELSKWWLGWYVDWIGYAVLGIVLLVVVLLERRLRRSRREGAGNARSGRSTIDR